MYKADSRESACFLAIIALEELGKAFIIMESLQKPVDDKSEAFHFNTTDFQGPHSHEAKIRRAITQSIWADNPGQDEIAKNINQFIKDMSKLATVSNRIKKNSLYISFKNGRFTQPSINTSDFNDLVGATAKLLEVMRPYCGTVEDVVNWFNTPTS